MGRARALDFTSYNNVNVPPWNFHKLHCQSALTLVASWPLKTLRPCPEQTAVCTGRGGCVMSEAFPMVRRSACCRSDHV